MSTLNLKSGPKTLAGKKRSAQNAIKTGVYVAKLLPNEPAAQYAAMRDAMIEDLEAFDAVGVTAVEEFAMTAVRKNRIIQAEVQYLAGVMQTEDARKLLAEKIHGSPSYARLVPWWFLQGKDCEEKKDAKIVQLALKQLDKLKAAGGQPTDQAIAFSYPELFVVVMWYQSTNSETFWRILMRVTQKQHISTCLETFQAKVEKSFEHHIEWAENVYRYQSVVNMVYAELVMRVMSKPEMIKLTNALNRQTEHALSVLHARGQLIDANQTSLTVQVTGSDASVHESTDQSHVTLDNVQYAQPPQDFAVGDVAENRNCADVKGAPSIADPNAASQTSDSIRVVEAAEAALMGEPALPDLADATNGDDAAERHQGEPTGVSREVCNTNVTGVDRQ